MKLDYALDETRIEMTEEEYAGSRSTIEEVHEEEKARGRSVKVVVRFSIHQATDKEMEREPRGRLFPRPVKSIGALTPEAVANELKRYAEVREQPASDVSRVLWTEFLAAIKRNGPQDKWAKMIESRLNDVRSMREARLPMSYAYVKRGRR